SRASVACLNSSGAYLATFGSELAAAYSPRAWSSVGVVMGTVLQAASKQANSNAAHRWMVVFMMLSFLWMVGAVNFLAHDADIVLQRIGSGRRLGGIGLALRQGGIRLGLLREVTRSLVILGGERLVCAQHLVARGSHFNGSEVSRTGHGSVIDSILRHR